MAIGWWGLARPEFGDAGDRLAYFLIQMGDSRLSIAFVVDLGCFWLCEIMLLGDLNPKDSVWQSLRFIPFFGMAFWLMF